MQYTQKKNRIPKGKRQLKTKKAIDIINDTDFELNDDILNTIFDWLKEDSVFKPNDNCCLKITNDITEYNAKYRGAKSTTDVLTFACDFPNIPFKGDIVIDINQAEKQKGNHSLMIEIAILFIHGLLHLAGLDHSTKKQQVQMLSYEERYRDRLRTIYNS
jgi:probable rRNA maturation factor